MSNGTGDQVGQQLSRLGVGVWTLAAADQVIVLDGAARTILDVPGDLTTSVLMSRVPSADRAALMGAFGAPGDRTQVGCDFRYLREDGEEISVRMLATVGSERAEGILYPLEAPVENLHGRAQWLGDFSEVLSSALTPQDVARAIQLKSEELLGVAYAGISELSADGETLHVLSTQALTLPVKQRWSATPVTDDSPSARVYRESRGFVYPSRERLLAVHPALAPETEESGVRAWAGMPLVVSGRTVGVLALYWLEERSFEAEDIQFLQALAGQCAQTLERARMYEKQEELVTALQHAVLPMEVPQLPGVSVAGRHLMAEGGLELGGGWHDAFHLEEHGLMLVAGTVVGKGGETAALMGQLRNAVRAYALEGYRPGELLGRLNHLVLTMYPGQYATVMCALLSDGGELCWANAGHPGMLLECDGSRTTLGEAIEPLIGAVPEQEYTEQVHTLPEGGTLVLHSGGLAESAGRQGSNLDRLERAMGAREHPLLEVRCSQLLEEMRGERRRDDLSLLMVRRRPTYERQSTIRLPETLQSPGKAREFVSQHLQGWGETGVEDTALLLVSEVVTNAVVHARSSAQVTLFLGEEELVVSVHDTSPLPPVRRRATLSAISGRGMGLIDSMADQWGVEAAPGGKDVWFSLSRSSSEDVLALIDTALLDEIAALTGETAQ